MRVSSHLILAVAALSGLAIVALAATGRGGEDNGTIVACVKPSGKIRIISSEDSCIPTETMLIWNIVGPEGQQGPEGEQGPQGEPGLTPEQEEILSHMSIVFLDDGMGNLIKTIRISGVNVQVVNGMDDTETTNGAGNLIIGYNEASFGDEDRSGSHNLVVGTDHTFNSYGGFVAGTINNITAPYASVSGGFSNTAGGPQSSISGGRFNTALGSSSSISGGVNNFAGGSSSSVSGGDSNTASGPQSSINGGQHNIAIGSSSSVSGGLLRLVLEPNNWRAGSLFENN